MHHSCKPLTDGIVVGDYQNRTQRPICCKWKVTIIGVKSIRKCTYFLTKERAYDFVKRYRQMRIHAERKNFPCLLVKKNCGGEWVTISAHTFDICRW